MPEANHTTPTTDGQKRSHRFIDISKETFGRWTVIECVGKDERGAFWWKCRCQCGTIRDIKGGHLKGGLSMSCGCSKIKDLAGQVFGQWTVVEYLRLDERGAIWKCKCTCGETREFIGWELTSKGRTPASCLCTRAEVLSRRKRTHGESKTRLYKIWGGIHSRCYDPNSKIFGHYGGRGIAMCEEWRTSYETFRDWALAHGYRDDLTIERDEVDGHYEPSNCRFIPRGEQSYNTRRTVACTAFGETKPISVWLLDPRCKVGGWTLRNRVAKGWGHEEAMTTPARKMNRRS